MSWEHFQGTSKTFHISRHLTSHFTAYNILIVHGREWICQFVQSEIHRGGKFSTVCIIATLKFIYIYVFFEYNYILTTKLNTCNHSLVLAWYTNIQNHFKLETCSPAWCLITAQMVDILPKMMIYVYWYVDLPHLITVNVLEYHLNYVMPYMQQFINKEIEKINIID